MSHREMENLPLSVLIAMERGRLKDYDERGDRRPPEPHVDDIPFF